MHLWMVFVAACGLQDGAFPGPDVAIAGWIRDLGDSDVVVRTTAEEALFRGHPCTRAAVEEAVEHVDPEVASRARAILKRWRGPLLKEAENHWKRLGASVRRDAKPGGTMIKLSGRPLGRNDLLMLRAFGDLKSLELRYTTVDDSHLELIAKHSELEVLNLKKTRITDAGLSSLSRLTRLKKLSLEATEVTDAGMKHLRPLKALETLYLGESKVLGEGLRVLKDLPRLRYLSFEESPLTDAGVAHLEGLPLETLGLDDTQVTEACFRHLKSMKNLEHLWFDNSCVPEKGALELRNLKGDLGNLKTLHLKGLGLSEEAKKKLGAAFPGVKFYW